MNLRYLSWLLTVCFLPFLGVVNAQSCGESGNVAIFSNYDGGNLIIDVNVDIPNLKIGISSYEPSNVTFTGAFVDNITEVIYAGYQPGQPGNDHCNGVLTANVNAPVGASVSILDYPPVTLQSPMVNYFGFMIEAGDNFGITGCSSCSNDTYQGGSNTAEQVIDFFLTQFGGELRFLKTQYACWCGVLNMDLPASCCQEIDTSTPAVSITAIPSLQLCAGETITLDAGPGYQSYLWNNGATSQTIEVTQAGTYSVEVSSPCGTAFAEVTTLPCGSFGVEIVAEEGCVGDNIVVFGLVTGGDSPYIYQFTPDFPNSIGLIFIDITEEPFLLELVVTDANGNVAQASIIIEAVEELPSFDLGTDFVLCDPQSIGIEIPGAESYLWSNGSTQPFIQITEPGVYTLTITNACGSATATVEALPCTDELSASVNSGVICAGEGITLTVNVNGGLAPYTYLWSPALPNQASNVVSPAQSTLYTITVTDSEGTQIELAATVEVINESLNVNLGGPYELCEPSVLIDASTPGGLNYFWSNGSFGPVIEVAEPGTYTVIVMGECTQVEASVEVLPCILPLEATLADAQICPGAFATLEAQVSGGLPPYTFLWFPSGNVTPVIEVSPSTTAIYTVTVIDAQGSQVTASATVSIVNDNLAAVNLEQGLELCDNPVTLNAFQSQALAYQWSTGSTQASITVSQAGTYSVTVSGACSSESGSAVVGECSALQVSMQGATICAGEQAILQAQVSGGAPPYQFSWSPSLGSGPGPFTVSPEVTTLYTLTVSDLEGNIAVVEALVQVNNLPVLPLWDDELTLCPGESIALSASIEGATAYQWSTGATSPSLLIVNPGTYSVSITTDCGILSQQVEVLPAPGSNVANVQTTFKGCIEDGPLLIGLFGATAPSLLWLDDNSMSPVYAAESSGVYTAMLENGCGGQVYSFNVALEQCECNIFVPNAFTPDGNGINDVFKPVINCNTGLYEFKIYDRWGIVVFESLSPEESWRGELMGGEYFVQSEVFFWTLRIQPELVSLRRDPIERKGYVTLIR